MGWAEPAPRGKWYARYTDPSGRKRRVAGSFTSKRAAKQAATVEEAKIRRREWRDPDVGKMTFSEYFEEHWLPSRINEANTLASYRTSYRTELKPTFGHFQLRRLHSAMIQDWVTSCVRRGVHPATLRKKYATLKLVLAGGRGRSALRDGLIAHDPCAGIDLPPERKPDVVIFQPHEYDLLWPIFTAIDDGWWFPSELVRLECGLRWGELAGLRVEDLTDRRLSLRRTVIETTRDQTRNGTRFQVKDRLKAGRSQATEERLLILSETCREIVQSVIAGRRLRPGDTLFAMPQRTKEASCRSGLLNGQAACRCRAITIETTSGYRL